MSLVFTFVKYMISPMNSGFEKENNFLRVHKVLENKGIPLSVDHYNWDQKLDP